jgi:hypothetical protein
MIEFSIGEQPRDLLLRQRLVQIAVAVLSD